MASNSETTWEVEQKYSVGERRSLERALQASGFELQREEAHRDLYFRHPCRDFRQTDEAFRLRQVNEDLVVTYKGPRADAEVKTRPETELGLRANEFTDWVGMLGQLGFEPLPEVRKSRQVFGCVVEGKRPFVVTIDQVEELGLFAEVELLVRIEADLGSAQDQVVELAHSLGLKTVERKSYLALLLQKLNHPLA
ncbi:MAG: class IV adenylate cyclase [Pirellulaceae bacterium]